MMLPPSTAVSACSAELEGWLTMLLEENRFGILIGMVQSMGVPSLAAGPFAERLLKRKVPFVEA